MSNGWAPTLAEHIKLNDADTPICYECGEMYELRNSADDTGFCDPCAQSMVKDALRYQFLRASEDAWVNLLGTVECEDADAIDRAVDAAMEIGLPKSPI